MPVAGGLRLNDREFIRPARLHKAMRSLACDAQGLSGPMKPRAAGGSMPGRRGARLNRRARVNIVRDTDAVAVGIDAAVAANHHIVRASSLNRAAHVAVGQPTRQVSQTRQGSARR